MARDPKIFIHDTLVELGSRTQQGLPFPPSRLTSLILGNILARAQNLYPITIVSICIMPNHFHILAVVHNPAHVSDFMEYFKRESANALNRLLGRRQFSVWTEGFDGAVILDPEMALQRLEYVYLNPVSAGLVPRCQDWKLSSASWVDFSAPVSKKSFKVIPRNKIPMLPEEKLTLQDIDRICDSLEALQDTGEATLTLEPYAWKRCFSEIKDKPLAEIHELLFSRIREEEAKVQAEKGDTFPSQFTLQTQDLRTQYAPQKFGKRMICYSTCKTIRIKFLSWVKEEFKKLPRYLKKHIGFYTQDMIYPPGFFAPGGIMFASLLPEHTPIPYLT